MAKFDSLVDEEKSKAYIRVTRQRNVMQLKQMLMRERLNSSERQKRENGSFNKVSADVKQSMP